MTELLVTTVCVYTHRQSCLSSFMFSRQEFCVESLQLFGLIRHNLQRAKTKMRKICSQEM